MDDYQLLKQCLETFIRIRHWVDEDFYRTHIASTVNRLRERVAVIEADSIKPKTISDIDTIPDRLEHVITNFGLFKK